MQVKGANKILDEIIFASYPPLAHALVVLASLGLARPRPFLPLLTLAPLAPAPLKTVEIKISKNSKIGNKFIYTTHLVANVGQEH